MTATAAGTPSSRTRFPWSRVERWFVLGCFALLAVRLAWFVDRHAVNMLFWDQWDFLQGLFDGADSWTLFRWQHGPQRQGVGNLLIAALYDATGWNVRADSAVSAGLVALAGAGGLWLIARLHGRLRLWDVAVPLLFLTTASAQTYVGVPNLAHGPLPVFFLMAFALALTVGHHVARCGLLVAINFLAVNTGFTFLLGPLTIALLAVFVLQPGLSTAERASYAAGIGASAASLALFLHDFSMMPAADCFQFPHARPWEYVPFAGFVLARPFGPHAGAQFGALALGASVTVAITAFAVFAAYRLLLARGTSASWNVSFALGAFALLFAMSTAFGRVCLGMPTADSSRYIPYVVPGLMGVYLALRNGGPSFRRNLLVALFLSACVLKERSPHGELEATAMSSQKRQWRDCYLRFHSIAECDERVGYSVYPQPEATHLQQKLDWLEAHAYNLFDGGDTRSRQQAALAGRKCSDCK